MFGSPSKVSGHAKRWKNIIHRIIQSKRNRIKMTEIVA
jgi:hypothetical protein